MKKKKSKVLLDQLNKHLSSGKINNFSVIKERLDIEENPASSRLTWLKWTPSFASGLASALFLIMTILSLTGNRDDGKEGANPISAMMSIIREDKARHLPIVFGLLFVCLTALTIVLLKKVKKQQ